MLLVKSERISETAKLPKLMTLEKEKVLSERRLVRISNLETSKFERRNSSSEYKSPILPLEELLKLKRSLQLFECPN